MQNSLLKKPNRFLEWFEIYSYYPKLSDRMQAETSNYQLEREEQQTIYGVNFDEEKFRGEKQK